MKTAKILRHLRAIRRLPARARLDLLRAQVALARARLSIRYHKRGQLLAVAAVPDTPVDTADARSMLIRARELATAVQRVSDHGLLHGSCLVRALATQRLLDRAGLPGAMVRVGVQIRNGRLTAHAWVEYAGTRLIESESELDDLEEVADLAVERLP